MGRYVLRRVAQAVPVFFGATFMIFAMVFAIPGEPIKALSQGKPVPPSVVDQLRDDYDLDDPLMIQYGKYMGILRDDDSGEFAGILPCATLGVFGECDLGKTFTGREVTEIIGQRFPVTARLAVAALVMEAIIGVIAGVLAGMGRGSFLDNVVRVSTVTVIAIPIFVLETTAQVGIIYAPDLPVLGWLPEAFWDWWPIAGIRQGWKSYLLPSILLASVSLAYVARLTRTNFVENLKADYVRTARAKGLPQQRVVGRHVLRNSLIPVVTFLGVDFGFLIGGAVVTETIFNIPGVGRAVYDGIFRQEGALVVGVITALVLVFIVMNLLVDILYGFLDPRIRYE